MFGKQKGFTPHHFSIQKRKSGAGFTLIELMIIVVCIGVLAAVAIPKLMRVHNKTQQEEAKTVLKNVYTMQQGYRQTLAKPCYADNGTTISAGTGGWFPTIGVEVQGNNPYAYTIVAGASTFTCTATANLDEDSTIDTWMIDQLGVLNCVVDDTQK